MQNNQIGLGENRKKIIWWILIIITSLLIAGIAVSFWIKEKEIWYGANIDNLQWQIANLKEENETSKSICQTNGKYARQSLVQDGIKNYVNVNAKYSFEYPYDLIVSSDKTSEIWWKENSFMENVVLITNHPEKETDEKNKVSIHIYVNSSPGPIVLDKRYILKETEDGTIKIDSEKIEDYKNSFLEKVKDPETKVIFAAITASNEQHYAFMVEYSKSGKDYEKIFKEIIESVRTFK